MSATPMVMVLLPALGSGGAGGEDPPWIARGRWGMVASDSAEASRIGAQVLEAGGNAFDAAVATSFALGVTRPYSTGLGGGGFMLAFVAAEGRCVALDFRETAPAAATPERYAELRAAQGEGPSASVYGGNAVATPGLLAGLEEIRRRFGTRPLSELVAPARALAEHGFEVDENYRAACVAALGDFAKWPRLREEHRALYEGLLGGGEPPAVGGRIRRDDLARALDLIAETGAEAVYGGPIGRAMAEAAQVAGGTLTLDDVRGYRVREREPIRVPYNGYEVVLMPPPSSGGICLAQVLRTVGAVPLAGLAGADGDGWAPVLVEAMKHAFADRARWMGDPDSGPVAADALIAAAPGAHLEQILEGRPMAPERYGFYPLPRGAPPDAPDDGGTSHFCVADARGNVVALTETINGEFGSLILVEPYGVVLNNEVDDFLTARGTANLYGLLQGEPNLVRPGRRPLSSMSPTIVTRAGRPVLALGASGGPRIISSVLQVMLHVIAFDRPLEEALRRPRFHHQWKPDLVFFDVEPPADVAALLRARGHRLADERRRGIVQAIQFLPDGTAVGASDPRKGGRPAAARAPRSSGPPP